MSHPSIWKCYCYYYFPICVYQVWASVCIDACCQLILISRTLIYKQQNINTLRIYFWKIRKVFIFGRTSTCKTLITLQSNRYLTELTNEAAKVAKCSQADHQNPKLVHTKPPNTRLAQVALMSPINQREMKHRVQHSPWKQITNRSIKRNSTVWST